MISHVNQYAPNNILPPQQIIQANGKRSIDVLRMSPNSSVLIADNTAPIVWKCMSDGLGNVTAEPFDISPHKTEEQKKEDSIIVFLNSIDERLKKLEEKYEQSTTEWNSQPANTKFISNKTGDGSFKKRKQPAEDARTNDAE